MPKVDANIADIQVLPTSENIHPALAIKCWLKTELSPSLLVLFAKNIPNFLFTLLSTPIKLRNGNIADFHFLQILINFLIIN